MDVDRLLEATAEIATPALVVDAAAAERNIERASAYFADRRPRLRPHFKAHKCLELLRRQLAPGDCAGVTCATAWEAEVVARSGLHDDVLVANEVVNPAALDALRRATDAAWVTVAVDSPKHVELLDGIECGVLIEVDVGHHRSGLDPSDEDAIVALAELVAGTPGLTLRGIQAYEGHAVLQPERAARVERVESAAAILNHLRTVIDCEIVTGGGTGTFDLNDHLDEVQAGSYVLMDVAYDQLDLPFELGLACRATIVSRNGTRAVCDAGLKAMCGEEGLPRALDPTVTVRGLADEHATLILTPDSPLQVGDPLLLVPGHIDPTINLHAALHAVEGDGTLLRWPVDASRIALGV